MDQIEYVDGCATCEVLKVLRIPNKSKMQMAHPHKKIDEPVLPSVAPVEIKMPQHASQRARAQKMQNMRTCGGRE